MNTPAENDTRDTFINPYYTINFASYLFKPEETRISKEDWVLANTKFIKDKGAETWLKQLLVNLSTEPTEDLSNMVMNPYQAVVLSESLASEHEALVDQATWIKANEKLMNELGIEDWLHRLLDVLETGGVTT